MRYSWSGDCAFDMAAMPKAAAEKLRLAGALALRVLIWLCCVGDGTFDASRCAADCGGSPADCEEALEYWVAQGLVNADRAAAPTPLPTSGAVTLAAERTLPQRQTLSVEQSVSLPNSSAPTAPKPTKAERPSREHVVETCRQDERFAFLLETAAVKLGKPLSPADMTVYLYLYRDLGLPPEVILMVIGYAVQNGKAKLAYIEKTAISWAEQGINTMAKADDYLCHLEHCRLAWETVAQWCALSVEKPTVSQKEAACRWIYDWNFPKDVVCFVAEYAEKQTGKFQAAYINRILEQLFAEGATTLEKVKERVGNKKPHRSKAGKSSRMKTDASREPSFDIGEYEQMALRHRPRTPPKG